MKRLILFLYMLQMSTLAVFAQSSLESSDSGNVAEPGAKNQQPALSKESVKHTPLPARVELSGGAELRVVQDPPKAQSLPPPFDYTLRGSAIAPARSTFINFQPRIARYQP